jgi:hypothetical protein
MKMDMNLIIKLFIIRGDSVMDKWKNLLYKQVKLNQQLTKKGITNPDQSLFNDVQNTMTELGYDVPKLIRQYKRRLQ